MYRFFFTLLTFSLLLSASFYFTSAQIFYYQTPEDSGFTPLLYPCDETTSNEFHPLRPYPASACDPLIPRKEPEAPLSTDPYKEYLTFTCNQPAVPAGTMTFPAVVDICSLPDYPGSTSSMSVDTLYDCGDNQVCSLRLVTWTLTFDLSTILLPIMGNTETYLSDAAKVNHYLDWYLGGVVQESDQVLLDPNNTYDLNRLVNYSGPVKKLLPKDSNLIIKDTLQGLADEEAHNYITTTTFWGGTIRLSSTSDSYYYNIPFSAVEDITGEITISIHPTQPDSIDGTIVLNDSVHPTTLIIAAPSDSRLHFPHLRTSNAQSLILASLHNPLPPTPTIGPPPMDPEDENFVGQVIPLHQGRPPVPGAADDTIVQIDTEYPGSSEITRNTEIREGNPAPPPLFTPVPVNCDPLEVRSNPGDHLVGQVITANLSYYQLFTYTPINDPVCFDRPCQDERETCDDNDDCCWGDCRGDSAAYCSGVGPCSSFTDQFVCTSYGGCVWHDATLGRCESYPDTELETAFRIASFTKTPEVEKVYDTLVSGNQSILRHFLPQEIAEVDISVYLPRDKSQSVPAYSQAEYDYSSTNVNSPSLTTGNGTSPPLIYFPHLGSLSNHFLGSGIPYENVNLQRLLRPYTPPVASPTPGASGVALQHLFEPTCGPLCYEYLISRALSETSCRGEVLNPYFAVAIALNENGGLVSCEPGATRTTHYGCDVEGLAGYSTTIEDKTSCMLNTLTNSCRNGASDLANLQNYGYTNGAENLSPLAVLGSPTYDLFVSSSTANSNADSLRSHLASHRDLWWDYYCPYIATYAESQCSTTIDCSAPMP